MTRVRIVDIDVRHQQENARRLNAAIVGFLIGFILFIAGYLAAALADGRFERQPVRRLAVEQGAIDVMAERGIAPEQAR